MLSKFNTCISRKALFVCFVSFLLLCGKNASAQYTSIYNSISHSSTRPYNLNIVYIRPSDVQYDPTYKKRLSALMLYAQNFYKQNMINNGYGAKTFGLFTETANPDSVKIIIINAPQPSSAYPYNNATPLTSLVDSYFSANPAQKTSEHLLVIKAETNLNTLNAPFYGTGRTCYALDYPQLDIQYMGRTDSLGNAFTSWYGGMVHELGHGLNLPHSHQTNTENADPGKGMNLMFGGNSTLGNSPTFVNRAGCAIENNCQLYANAPGTTYYNGHNSLLTGLHTTFSNGNLIVSGKYISNRPVTDINIYQDPFATPSAGYYRIAWSTAPIGTDSFYISMPVSELETSNQAYNLQIELVLQNGETQVSVYPFNYNNGVPDINVNFSDASPCSPLPSGWQLAQIGTANAGIGCYSQSNGNFRVKSYSQLTNNQSDTIPFLYTTLTGNGTIEAKLKDVSSIFNSRGGIMMRNTLAPNSRYVFLNALDTRGLFDEYRITDGQSSGYHPETSMPTPFWVKLQRTGNTITSYYSANGTNWTNYYTYNIALNSTIYIGISALWSGGTVNMDHVRVNGVALPVGLMSFQGRSVLAGINELTWTTGSEHNSSHFEIERSMEGKEFTTLDKVQSYGESSKENNYQYYDNNAGTAPVYFYRLKQVDHDGAFTHSNVVSITNKTSESTLVCFPNPVRQLLQLILPNTSAVNQIVLYNIYGQKLLTQDGSSTWLDMNNMAAGTYIVEVKLKNGESMRKQVSKL